MKLLQAGLISGLVILIPLNGQTMEFEIPTIPNSAKPWICLESKTFLETMNDQDYAPSLKTRMLIGQLSRGAVKLKKASPSWLSRVWENQINTIKAEVMSHKLHAAQERVEKLRHQLDCQD